MNKRLLMGNDIDGRVLTIIHIEKHPSRFNAKELCPFVTFAEFPDCHYEAGIKLKDNIDSWVDEVGDTPDSTDYPKVNAALTEIGGIRAYFEWKKSQKDCKRSYMNVILC